MSGELGDLAIRQRWREMAALISDEMLDVYAVRGRWADLPRLIQRRYGGLLDRVMYYMPYVSGEMDARWQQAAEGFEG